MNTTFLVTGAQGFVGRYLVAQLLTQHREARIIGMGRSKRCDRFTHEVTWNGERIPAPLTAELEASANNPRYTYLQGDIRERAPLCSILAKYQPSIILHLASGLRDDHPNHLFSTNVEGTIALLESVYETLPDINAIVIASSGSVYGLQKSLPLKEDTLCAPRDFYAASKLAEEHVSRIFAAQKGLPIIWGRIFNIVGPGQDERHVVGKFAAQIAAIAAGIARPRLEIGDLTPTRDFIDVRDVAGSLVALASCGTPHGTYNIARGEEIGIAAILDMLVARAHLENLLELDHLYVRPSDIPRVVADVTLLRSTGYQASVSLTQSLSDALAYYSTSVASAVAARLQR